ncbi:MAG TPA: signal recognition particle protein, partial [Firmicutes bacterium]|nr:signal recognition particle protein [Bacillota bacterium]
MAFESLTEKFSNIFKKMRRESTLTEANMDAALKEIRIALLEADVNYKVVKAFTNDVKEKA